MTGEELKNILVRNGLQQKDIAEKLSMSQQNFGASLKVRDIKTGFLEQICDALNVSMDFFYHGTKYAPGAVHVSALGNQSIATNSGAVTVGGQNENSGRVSIPNSCGSTDTDNKEDNVTTLTETVSTLTKELETSQQQKSSLIEIVANFQKQLQQFIEIMHHSNNK